MLERLFRLSDNQTSIRQEIVGGCTTFLTMSYIIFMQPIMLSNTGMDFNAVMAATCISSALACLCMAFMANYPIALAPAVGLNAYFTYTVCIGMKIPWETALGAVFISGVIFLIMNAFGLRKLVMDAIPVSLKFAIAVGIGVLIALLGFEWSGIVVNDDITLLKVGELNKPYVWVSGIGLLVAMILTSLNIRGAILFGIITSSITAMGLDLISVPGAIYKMPSWDMVAPTFMHMNPWAAFKLGFGTIIFTFFIIDLFDTVGTLVGVAQVGGFMQNNELPRAKQAFFSDAIGTVIGAILGTSTVTSFVESTSGISDGARTGLANVATACLFLLALTFSPLVEMLGQGIQTESGAFVYPIISPALIMVGFMMMRGVKNIPWDDYTESLPAFITIMLIGFSFSITDGIAFGIICFTILKLLTGKVRDIHPVMLLLSIVFTYKLTIH